MGRASRGKQYKPYFCVDCKYNTCHDEYYMVTNEIWREAKMIKGMLCISCLEKRLGRELIPEDFTECLVNDFGKHTGSTRLKLRLGVC
jgi:hypothetical protein